MKLSSAASAALLAVSLAGLPGTAPAAPLQITTGIYNSLGPSLSADGSRLAFYSAANLTGGNPDNGFEIHTYERSTGQLRQITDMTGGGLAGGHQEPSLSGDGSRIAFQRFTQSGGFGFFQTQTFDLNTNTLTTLTPLQGNFESSAISRNGKVIAVDTANLGIRLFDTTTQTFSGVVAPSSAALSISGDGKRLAFETFNGGVKLLDVASGLVTDIAPQTSSFNERPVLSADGNTLAFVSNYNPLGQNADGNRELFSYDVQTQTLHQLTHSLGGYLSLGDSGLSGDGSRIAFSASTDLTGENADGNAEIFIYDLIAGEIRQLTRTLNLFSADAALSDDGLTVAYVSGGGRGGSQIFLDTLPPQQTAALPEPASLALALGALGLLAGLRRGPNGGRPTPA